MLKGRKISIKTQASKSPYLSPSSMSPCKRLICSATPCSDSLLEKRLINAKIPTPKTKRIIYQGFKIKNCSLHAPFYQRTLKGTNYFGIEDSDSNYEIEYQQLIKSFFQGQALDLFPSHTNTEDHCKSELRKSEVLLHKNTSKLKGCGRYRTKHIAHSKYLLPQTSAKRKNSRPAVCAKLKVNGTQTGSWLSKSLLS